MNHTASDFVAPIALMAAATGARTMVGVTAASRVRSPELMKVAAAFALLELLGDKIPGIPNRTDLGPMIGRTAAGAFIGASVAHATGRDRVAGALVGSLFAIVGAQLSFRLRRSLTRVLPPFLAAAAEDAVVLATARFGANRLAKPSVAKLS
jgi:uncharacterized membrane protein